MSICLRSRQNLFTMHSKWRNKLLHLLKRGFSNLCTDVPLPQKKNREKRRRLFSRFFWGRGDVCTQARFQDQFPDVQFDWNEIYSLSLKVSLKTKIKNSNMVLNNIVSTNEKLSKIKMTDSPQCTFCKNETESLEHLFYNCEMTRSFWVTLRSWLVEYNINLKPSSVFNVLFGIFNAGEDFVIVNHLILEAKFYIYRCKLNGVKPAMRVLKTKIGAIHNIEGRIAFMRNKVEFHEWEKIKCCLNWVYPPLPPAPFFSLSATVICIFLLSSIQIFFSG